jgi:zinc transport system substrate-binding protein
MKNKIFLILYFVISASNCWALEPKIVVSIRPIYSIVKNLQCDANIQLLSPKNISPHHFHLKPSEMKMLEDADIIILVSKELESSLYNTIKQRDFLLKKTIILDQVPGITLLKLSHTHHHHHHDHGIYDPHIWLDIKNMNIISNYIKNFFSEKYPSSQQCLAKKYEELKQKLNYLQEQINIELRPYKNEHIVVLHDAYNYLLKQYGIYTVGVVLTNFNSTPSLASMTKLQNIIKENNVKCIFAEPQFSVSLINKIAQITKTKVAILDAEWGEDNIPDTEIYFELMKNNVNSIVHCLK